MKFRIIANIIIIDILKKFIVKDQCMLLYWKSPSFGIPRSLSCMVDLLSAKVLFKI